jgi:hypothetical protein
LEAFFYMFFYPNLEGNLPSQALQFTGKLISICTSNDLASRASAFPLDLVGFGFHSFLGRADDPGQILELMPSKFQVKRMTVTPTIMLVVAALPSVPISALRRTIRHSTSPRFPDY